MPRPCRSFLKCVFLIGMEGNGQKKTPQTVVCGVCVSGNYSTTASYWMELTTPSVRMMVRVEVVPFRM